MSTKLRRTATMFLTVLLLLQAVAVPAAGQSAPAGVGPVGGATVDGPDTLYSIAGRVVDGGGYEVAGVTVTATPKSPLLVVHGIQVLSIDGYDCNESVERLANTSSTLGDLPGWFQDRYDVWIAHLTSSAKYTPALTQNAQCLRTQVNEVYQRSGNRKVTIIAHSMGGLVTRACLAMPDCRDKVKSVYTLGSPHAGLNSALVGKILIKLAEGYLNAHGLPIPVESGICLWQSALCQMSAEEMLLFNVIPGNGNQRDIEEYTFIGGEASPVSYGLGWLIQLTDGSHDGIVGSSSAVGWVYPFNGPLPTDWMQANPPTRYWTDEVHFEGFDGFAYYSGRGGGESRSFDCIAYQEGFEFSSQPSWCKSASARIAAADMQSPTWQTTHSIDGIIAPGEMVTHTLVMDGDAAAAFTLAWTEGDLRFALQRPDGTVVTPAYAAANPATVSYVEVAGNAQWPPAATFQFTATVPGVWQLMIDGTGLAGPPVAYTAFAAMETPRLFTVEQNADLFDVGETAIFTGTLVGANGGIGSADVVLTLQRPDGIVDTVVLADQGGGIYRGDYLIPNAGGRVAMTANANGVDGEVPFTRQAENIWTISPPDARFLAVSGDRAEDDDGDGLFDRLVVEATIEVSRPATYTLSALLSHDSTPIATSAVNLPIPSPGSHVVALEFSGSDINAAAEDGPFQVRHVTLTSADIGDVLVASVEQLHETAPYRAKDFYPGVFPDQRLFLPIVSRQGDVVTGSNQVLQNEFVGGTRSMATYAATTDAEGFYTIGNLPEGTYDVVASYTGWNVIPTKRSVTLPENASNVTFVATPPDIDTVEEIFIPGGSFQMGCDLNSPFGVFCFGEGELPLHIVNLSAYHIDKYEVTNARYKLCVAAGKCGSPLQSGSFTRPFYFRNPDYDNYPVIFVTWHQARAFCEWAGKRLPTEAEWEKAARGAEDTRAYPIGDFTPYCPDANYVLTIGGYCVGDTDRVDARPRGASPYGVIDMAGNVREWVNDWYSEDYYDSSPATNPQGTATGSLRVVRDGSWRDEEISNRTSNRGRVNPAYWYDHLGFRCAHSP